ncbi:MAG: CPBP family intramembrane glutamic endopeptidase [Candidatus Micrarchaeia archaeon]
MKLKKFDYIYFGLPLILWPLSFILFSNYFVYAMTISTVILATITLLKYKDILKVKSGSIKKILLWGAIGAAVLYLIFLVGYYLSIATNTVFYVVKVYKLIYIEAQPIFLFILLAIIGICEEFYWRGGVQALIRKKSKLFKKMPWVGAALYYGLIHISTLNPILVLAALFVGIVTSILAEKYGILSSMIAHVVWIEFIIIFLPVILI